MPNPFELLTTLAEACSSPSTLWTGIRGAVRLYLTCPTGSTASAYIWVDDDGDFRGESRSRLPRLASARVWGPWEKAATDLGAKLYA